MSVPHHAPTPLLEPSAANLWRVAACIRQGGVVVVPTDADCALAADPTRPDAVDRLYAIKRCPRDEPLTLFVRDPSRWRDYGRPDPDGVADHLTDAHWPGPLVVTVDAAADGTGDEATAGGATAGVTADGAGLDDRLHRDGRVSIGCVANPVWRELAAHLDGPLAMTPANRYGRIDDDILVDVGVARDQLGDRVDLVVDADPPRDATAATVVDVTDGPRVRRHGDLDLCLDELEAAVDAV